ncbi:MAG: SDR family oxidoreductase [Gammaproteobacteria bacterium]|nr:SDR family oxidoreductase [Gammaproteobacteria bacterium]
MKTLTILLGANGCLGMALLEKICDHQKTFVVAIDQHEHAFSNIANKYMQCDLRDPEQILEASENIALKDYDEVVIISTVGLFGEPSFVGSEFDEHTFYESLQVNLVGVTTIIAKLLAKRYAMVNGRVRVVVVSSSASYVGSLNLGYGVSKAGLNGFVRSISKSLAHDGVTCIGVTPGIFASKMSKSVSIDRQQKALSETHTKRMVGVDEVADFVSYLAYNASDNLTGTIIPFNGGQYS